ncbi:S-adenosylmethionine sensor upstream of mTORC1-like [Eriocheir sinensis]|uniref:S-adenosylmethionine sensor upstream of mTORC1-like n=1 Tax=Eriocheir sinensis TaxID=95602 RepID=UPI0021C94562|nr:S-adenosylmethionine sensor upstream of mTORC1-like [Eriocheir sinensis]XP_050731820.1 S-adenosylmethionine sensor upstream of mTORC1-like [Eriocheir sinensis]
MEEPEEGGEGETAVEGEEGEGKRLAEVVKGTHRLLRAQYKEAGEGAGAGAKVWREHLEREEQLNRYAQAMHTLATQHWPSDDQASMSRVGWVRAAVRDYYWGGGLLAATDKEMRKLSHLELTPDQPHSPQPPPPDGTVRVLDVGSCYNPFRVFPEFEVTAIDLCPAHESVFKGDFLNLEIMEKEDEGGGREEGGGKGGGTKVEEEEKGGETTKRKEEEERKTHTVIKPEDRGGGGGGREKGEKDVKEYEEQRQGGQGKEERGEEEEGKRDEEEGRQAGLGITPTTTTTITITTLPASSFHVIVLSLVLEYLPAPTQRLECCARAWRLLAPGGLLAIITPDSRHQGANAHLYQLWRVSLAGLGFGRIKYDKQTHFHGFLFRKGLCRAAWQSDVPRFLSSALSAAPSVRAKLRGIDYSKVHQELYIPQDFEGLEGSGRKRVRRGCDQTDGRKKQKKESEGGGKGEMDEGEREEKGRRKEHEGKDEERHGREEVSGRRGEINGNRKREEEEVKEESGEKEVERRGVEVNGKGEKVMEEEDHIEREVNR